MWGPVTESLLSRYRLLVPDLRGHGRSTNPCGQFTHDQAAADIFGLLEHLDVESCKAIGISTGGMTLLHMATQQPARLNAMVLIGTAHYWPRECRDFQEQLTIESLSTEEDAWGGYEKMRCVHAHGDEQIRVLRRQFHEFKDSYNDVNFTKPLLGTIDVPTLIVHGDRDPVFPVEIPFEMYKAIPNSYLWIVPGGGHVPIYGPSRFPLVPEENVPFVSRTFEFFAEVDGQRQGLRE